MAAPTTVARGAPRSPGARSVGGWGAIRGPPRNQKRQRLGHADPASALDHGEERRVRALVLVGAEADLGAVEDVAVALDRLQALHEAVDGQVLARLLEPGHREIGGHVAVDRADVRLDLVACPCSGRTTPGRSGSACRDRACRSGPWRRALRSRRPARAATNRS